MAKYLILIYGDEQRWATMTPRERRQLDDAHQAFIAAAGPEILAGGELTPASAATTLRTDPAGQLSPTDGPFLETKEAVGGYYLVETADLGRVIELAARLYEVSAGHSGVEIRQLINRP